MDEKTFMLNQIASLEAEQKNLQEQFQRTEGGLTICRHRLGQLMRAEDEAKEAAGKGPEGKQPEAAVAPATEEKKPEV